jgi:hypothetical protein
VFGIEIWFFFSGGFTKKTKKTCKTCFLITAFDILKKLYIKIEKSSHSTTLHLQMPS